jgi:hypothetical protein
MKDVNATIIIELENKTEEDIWRGIKYTRRKYVQQGIKSELVIERDNSEPALKQMYEINMQVLKDGGTAIWSYERWLEFVKLAGDKFFLIKLDEKVIGCFALSEITKRFYGFNSDRKGIRPVIFASYKEYNDYRPNDFMYWQSIKYAKDHAYSFIDLGGWQIKAKGHLQGVNHFKEEWGGRLIYYYLDYPFFTAIRRKLIRNSKVFWNINQWIKNRMGTLKRSTHDSIMTAEMRK